MKIAEQTSLGLIRVGGMIAHIPVAMMTNVARSGDAVSRPMSPIEMDADGCIWFLIHRDASVLKSMCALNLSFIDMTRAVFVSFTGCGELQLQPAQAERRWPLLSRPWVPIGRNSQGLAALRFIPEMVSYWLSPHSKVAHMFSIAASLTAGQTSGCSEQEDMVNLSLPSPNGTGDKPVEWRYNQKSR